jgi:hypothetical protein
MGDIFQTRTCSAGLFAFQKESPARFAIAVTFWFLSIFSAFLATSLRLESPHCRERLGGQRFPSRTVLPTGTHRVSILSEHPLQLALLQENDAVLTLRVLPSG